MSFIKIEVFFSEISSKYRRCNNKKKLSGTDINKHRLQRLDKSVLQQITRVFGDTECLARAVVDAECLDMYFKMIFYKSVRLLPNYKSITILKTIRA